MNRMYFNVAITSVYLALGASVSLGRVGELTPSVRKVEFKNDSMVVVHVHLAPREKTPMPDMVSPRLVIWLTDAHLKDTGPDGKAIEYSRTRGSID